MIEDMGDYVVLWKNCRMQRWGKKRPRSASRLVSASIFVCGEDVYIAGSDLWSSPDHFPLLFKNGNAQRMDCGSMSEAYSSFISSRNYFTVKANSIFVWDGDVYIVGTHEVQERSDNPNSCPSVATLWKNGKGMFLGDVEGCSEAHSVYVSDGNVYVAGSVGNSHGKNIATLWKDGVPTSLSNGNRNAKALSVYVSGKDAYVAGYEENAQGKTVAMLWKNGRAKRLSKGTRNATACSVSVSGKDIYVALNEYYVNGRSTIRLWKNGEICRLRGDKSSSEWRRVNGEWMHVRPRYCNAEAGSLFVSNGDVYIAGREVIYYYIGHCYVSARLWKNGVLQHLVTAHDTEAYSVFVAGEDVYMAGVERIIWHL